MNFKIIWDRKAEEAFRKLEKNIAIRIYKKINFLQNNFNSADIKRLQNSGLFRLRIGDYRVLFEVNRDTITILKIGNRRNIYK